MTVIPNPRYSPFMPSLCRSSFADAKEDAADVPYDDVCVRVLMTSVGTRMRQAACGGIMHVGRTVTQTEGERTTSPIDADIMWFSGPCIGNVRFIESYVEKKTAAIVRMT